MAAYVIVDVLVTDQEVFDVYKSLSPAAVAAFGGKYLARGGETAVLEGQWIPNRLVLLEFDSLEKAKTWLDSPEYAHAKELRHIAASTNMVAIEGV